jgi:hypothetical protein
MHKENYDAYINRGMDSNSALTMADQLASKARAQIKEYS